MHAKVLKGNSHKGFKNSILFSELPHSLVVKKGLDWATGPGFDTYKKFSIKKFSIKKFSIKKFSINPFFKPYKFKILVFQVF
jgi:hypothetical protein